MIHCVGRPIAVDWALSKDRYQKAVEHSGTFTFDEVFVSFHYCCWQQLMFIVYIYIYIFLHTISTDLQKVLISNFVCDKHMVLGLWPCIEKCY